MERHISAFLGTYVLLLCGTIFVFRKDLRLRMVKFAAVGTAFFVVHILITGAVSVIAFLEGLLLSGTISALAPVLYEVLANRKSLSYAETQKVLVSVVLAVGIISYAIFAVLFSFPGLLVALVVCMVATLILVAHRIDLCVSACGSGVFLVSVMLPVYFLLFDLLLPTYWQDQWVYYLSPVGWMLGRGVPFVIMLWYFVLGAFLGTITHVYAGTAPLRAPSVYRRILKKGLGVLCIGIGVFSLVTPFTPGSWLTLVGLELLGLGFLIPKKIRRYWDIAKSKLPGRLSDFLKS